MAPQVFALYEFGDQVGLYAHREDAEADLAARRQRYRDDHDAPDAPALEHGWEVAPVQVRTTPRWAPAPPGRPRGPLSKASEKRGGYSGSRPGEEMRPPARLPSGSARPGQQPPNS